MRDSTVEDYTTSTAPVTRHPGPVLSYGTIRCGFETMTKAWPRMAHAFSIGGHRTTTATYVVPGTRAPQDLLVNHPVDMLIVEQGHRERRPKPSSDICLEWRTLVQRATEPPGLVIETWTGSSSLWVHGPMSKACRTRWKDLGYSSRGKLVDATALNGAIRQLRFIVTRTADTAKPWAWAPVHPPDPKGNGQRFDTRRFSVKADVSQFPAEARDRIFYSN